MPPLSRLADYVLCAHALGTSPLGSWSIFWRQTKNIRVRLGLGGYHPERVYTLQTTYGPLYFRDNFGDITNLVGLFYRPVYRVGRLPRDGVILDVGANIGLAAAWFARHNPGRTIYCFEPLAANTALIGLNCPGARIEQVALGAGPGRVTLSVDRDSVMASRLATPRASRRVEFGVIALDDFARAEGLERIALIKIDAEGMEADILQGARETLRKAHQVVLETHSPGLHREAIEHLERAGLRIDSAPFRRTTGFVFASRASGRG